MDSIISVGIFLAGLILGAVGVRFFSSQNKVSRSEYDLINSEKLILQTRLETEKESLIKIIEQREDDLKKLQEKFEHQFQNLANKIFEESNTKFKKMSQESLGEMLNPLKEKITDFQKKMDESFGSQAKEQFSLKEEIKRIVEVNEKMNFQTESLSKALRGDVKAQGNWGEIILERILEESGLRKDEDYVLQGSDMGLKNSDGSKIQRPDVIVKLPEGKHIIVDSKVSLTHYERFCMEENNDLKNGHLKQFLASIRNHTAGLSQRGYQDNNKLGTPDFVLMFMPIEGAYSLAMQHDQSLHNFAWEKKIVIVCPSTLFATMRTIASLWRLELQNRNAVEIAKRGGELYDKIAGFIEDMQKLGIQLENADKTYHGAMNKLSEGRGNILRRAEQLKELGAKASKSLPQELISAEDNEEDNLKIEQIG